SCPPAGIENPAETGSWPGQAPETTEPFLPTVSGNEARLTRIERSRPWNLTLLGRQLTPSATETPAGPGLRRPRLTDLPPSVSEVTCTPSTSVSEARRTAFGVGALPLCTESPTGVCPFGQDSERV